MSNNTNASSPTYGLFLDVQKDVKPWLQITASNTDRDQTLELLTDMVCTWIQNYLGRPVGPTKYTWRFDGFSGWNGSFIMLPRAPVLEVVSVTEYWGSSGPHNLLESTPENQTDGWQLVPETGRLNRVFQGNVPKPWFPGERNIEVVWMAGMNPVPATIKVAALELLGHWFHNTQQNEALGAPGVRGYDEDRSEGTLWTGVPYRVVDLIEPYIQVSMG